MLRLLFTVILGFLLMAVAGVARGEPPNSADWIEGKIARVVEAEGGKSRQLVIKDEAGTEHTFFGLKGQKSVAATVYPHHVGERIRLYWKFESDPATGEKVKDIVEIADGEVQWPDERSKEGKAIVQAARAAYQEEFKERPAFAIDVLKTENGAAGFVARVKRPKAKERVFVVLLRGAGSEWTVVDSSADTEMLAAQIRLARMRTQVPRSIKSIWDQWWRVGK